MFDSSYLAIRRRVFIATGFVLLLLVMLFCWSMLAEYRNVIRNAEKNSASHAHALKEHGERVFAEADTALKNLCDDINEHGGLPFIQTEQFYRLLKNIAQSAPQFSSAYFVDANGNITAHSQEFRVKPILVADRDYYLHQVKSRSSDLYISKPFTSRISGTSRFAMSRPYRSADGSLSGVVVVTYEASYFEKFYKTVDAGSHGRIILSTTSGDILITEPNHEKSSSPSFASSTLFTSLLPNARSGTFQGTSRLSNDKRIVSYNCFDGYPIVAIVSLSKDDVTRHWLTSLYEQGSFVLLLMVIIVLLSRLFLSQFRRLDLQQKELQIANTSIEKMLEPVYWISEDSRIIKTNDAACAMLGYSMAELLTRTIPEIDPLMTGELWALHWLELRHKGSVKIETRHKSKEGRLFEVAVVANMIDFGDQQLNCATVRDITERKAFEKQLSTIALEWQETFDASEDAVWLLDTDRVIIRANSATEPIFGQSAQEIVGRRCCDIVQQESYSHEICPFDQMMATGKRATMQMRKDSRWYEISLDPVFDEEGTIFRAVHVVKDITDLKRAEIREHIRSEILERIARGDELSSLLSFIARAIEKERPEALCSILLVSEDGKRLLNGAAPSFPEAYNLAVNRTRIGEGIGSCGTAAYRNERVVVEDIATHPFWKGFVPAEDAGLRSCWSEPIRSSSGEVLGTFAIYHREPATPGVDEIRLIEQASAFAGIAIERHRAESDRTALEEQLHQSQKMEAIGHLAGGMAHDFNNLLTPIIIYADMLHNAIPEDDKKALGKLQLINAAALKARDLTHQLLSFGRKQPMQTRAVDLNEVLHSFYPMVRRTLRENIDIQLKTSPQPQIITADRPKLEQIILNLALNAKDAIAANGTITIETGHIHIDAEYARFHPGMEVSAYTLLTITDSGCGMSEKTLQHIFEPFYTTKEAGEGTGLGLANVYGIVKQHNGYIDVISMVDKGTTFKIFFPTTDQALAVEQPEAEYSGDYRGTETILLVEDDAMVREMVTELLNELGYALHVAAHPDQALKIARQLPGKIDLLISDIVMPGMNGRQLFRKLQEERQDLGVVLYISGYDNNVITNAALESEEHFLAKPFTTDDFMAKVRGLLDRGQ